MIAPDQASVQHDLQQHVAASTAVTQYAQAVQTLVPTESVSDPTLQAVLQAAQTHAATWSGDLCPSCTGAVPAMFVDFAPVFAAQAASLEADVAALQNDPADAAATADLSSRLAVLAAALEQRGQAAEGLLAQVTTYSATLETDARALAAAVATLAASSESGVLVSRAQSALTLDFVSSEMLSPCLAIVTIEESVSVDLTEVAGNPGGADVVAAVLSEALFEALRANAGVATQALSALMDTWQTLVAKFRATANALQAASGPALPPILAELDVQSSEAAWNQLATFAGSLNSATPISTSGI